MERRVLLAILLAFLVLYAWQALFVKPVPKPAAGKPPAAGTTVAGTAAPAAQPGTPAAEAAPAEPLTPTAATLVGDQNERDVRVETRTVIAVFTNRGGRLKSWRLKRYRDQQGQPQELVETRAGNQPLPFSLRTSDTGINTTLNNALYTVVG